MSTPTGQSGPTASKPTPRTGGAATGAFTPSAASPPRTTHSPAHLGAAAQAKTHKSPHKATPASSHLVASGTGHTPMPAGSHLAPTAAVHTPTPLGGAALSPAAHADAAPTNGRGRGSTLGGKSTQGSEANTPALSGLAGLGLIGAHGLLQHAAAEGAEEARARTSELLTQRIREVADLLATRWGRVSQESLVACVPRLSLEGMWEDGLGDAEVVPGKRRNYIIAGKGFSAEIDWLDGRVQAVVLDLPNAREAAKRTLGRAAEILRHDLVGWKDEAVTGSYVDLKDFAENLRRLAQTDQLGQDRASCFEALEGLFVSFTKIWDWEHSKDKPDPADLRGQKAAELQVMCERTGRPTMHANRRIGLKLDYWLDRRLAYLSDYEQPEGSPGSVEEHWGRDDRLWSLLVEFQSCDPTQYPPMRISTEWVGDPVSTGMDHDAGGLAGGINWMDPPALMISTNDSGGADHDPMDIDAAIRQANNSSPATVRFVARFSPPVTVAYSTAMQIFQLVGQPLEPETLTPYLAQLFPAAWEQQQQQQQGGKEREEQSLTFRRVLYAFDASTGAAEPRSMQYQLSTYPPLAGRTLHEIPFSHPSQLITILPVLRQWVVLGKLLQRSVGIYDAGDEEMATMNGNVSADPSASRLTRAPSGPRARSASPPSDTDSEDDEDEHPASRGPGHYPQHRENGATSVGIPTVDLTLGISPAGRLDLDIAPLVRAPAPRRGTVRVLLNGAMVVAVDGADEVDGTEEGMGLDGAAAAAAAAAADPLGRSSEAEARSMTRALELCEDLGMLSVWLDARVSSAAAGSATTMATAKTAGSNEDASTAMPSAVAAAAHAADAAATSDADRAEAILQAETDAIAGGAEEKGNGLGGSHSADYAGQGEVDGAGHEGGARTDEQPATTAPAAGESGGADGNADGNGNGNGNGQNHDAMDVQEG